jgi:hypothetical protein
MGYMHIDNLYKNPTILMFKECYALEKVHGTSAHIKYIPATQKLNFFSGGESYSRFEKVFTGLELYEKFAQLSLPQDKEIVVYGEAYGGKQQGMSATYGTELCFVAFDVKIGDFFLNVPEASAIAGSLGLEFVPYARVTTDLASLDAERDRPSQIAKRRGIVEDKISEGVVLRPIYEMRMNNDRRIIVKHKRDEFRETASPRTVELDPARQKVLDDAFAIALEWVTLNRMEHVLQRIPNHDMSQIPRIIEVMQEDVWREAVGEVVDSPEARKAVSRRTVEVYKTLLKANLELQARA